MNAIDFANAPLWTLALLVCSGILLTTCLGILVVNVVTCLKSRPRSRRR